MTTFVGRLSIDLSNSYQFVDAYLKRYPVEKFICYYETKDKTGDANNEKLNNPHIHFITTYSNPKKSLKQDISVFMKQFKQYCPHDGQNYYHKECKNHDKALAYTIKDGHEIFTQNYSFEEIEEAENRVEQFNEDTKKSALMKLNDRFQKYNEIHKIDEEPDSFRLFKKVKRFVLQVYAKEYKTEISMSRLNSLSLLIIDINNLLIETDLLDII